MPRAGPIRCFKSARPIMACATKNGDLDYDKLARYGGKIRKSSCLRLSCRKGPSPARAAFCRAPKSTKIIAETRGIEEGADSISPNRRRDVANAARLGRAGGAGQKNHRQAGRHKIRSRSGRRFGRYVYRLYRRWKCFPSFITLGWRRWRHGRGPRRFDGPCRYDAGRKPAGALMAKLGRLWSCATRFWSAPRASWSHRRFIAWALAEGAVAVNSARGAMFALGCIQALQCDKNTCPTGITTHDKRRVRGLDPTGQIGARRQLSDQYQKTSGLYRPCHWCALRALNG